MEPSDRKLRVIGRGKEADLILGLMGERLRDHKEKLLAILKAKHRQGVHDVVSLSTSLAAYCAIEDLEAELIKERNQGFKNQQETHAQSEPGKPESR